MMTVTIIIKESVSLYYSSYIVEVGSCGSFLLSAIKNMFSRVKEQIKQVQRQVIVNLIISYVIKNSSFYCQHKIVYCKYSTSCFIESKNDNV